MKIYTLGFAKKSAKAFFETLRTAGVSRLLDIRLNNTSQLAGYTKRADLEYFCHAMLGIEYGHLPLLAPTKDILDAYKKHGNSWEVYEREFKALLVSRRPEAVMNTLIFDRACLLCAEPSPDHCHRRLVAEYLAEKWISVDIIHL